MSNEDQKHPDGPFAPPVVRALRAWLPENGYTDSDRFRYAVQTAHSSQARLTLRSVEDYRCDRCVRRGPGVLARLAGSCSGCERAENSKKMELRVAAERLEKALRDHFTFSDPDLVPGHRSTRWAIETAHREVSFYLDSVNENGRP
ncbi:hypothetical protein [Streptomyces nanshensis]|uniref:Uncharacterized protein n=1 Tax=Streptomyces nanshensis TaxID=518642 RepID=A0A1E7L1J6_9ACTN|nr:hypothetical protein [Streptomyces nanshensis]OEV09933.1 hypothetical protein AN218_19865 [Streptomyces nanshensis]